MPGVMATPKRELDAPPPSVRFDLPREAPGAPPGTLVIESEERPAIHLMDYDEDHFEEVDLARIEDAASYLKNDRVTWIDIRGIGHAPTFEALGKMFDLHPLALEDMVNVPQRPKVDVFPEQQLLITRMASIHEGTLHTEQMAILFGKGFVVTVQEEPDVDCLDPLRNRLRTGGSVRRHGADHLAHALLDSVVDGFFPVLEHFGEVLDDIELRALSVASTSPQHILAVKRDLLSLRRAIWPQRDLLAALLRDESPHISAETRPYFRDTYDHLVQLMDMVETFREIVSGLMDLLMSGASNRLNEVMKVLTVVSTVFLPMTFIAGVYGMNFATNASPYNMPELAWRYGYPFSIVLMIASATSLLVYYWHKGWIGRRDHKKHHKPARRDRRRRHGRPPVSRSA